MHDPVSSLQGVNLSMDDFLKHTPLWARDVLGALCFSVEAAQPRDRVDMDIPCLCVPMRRMDAADAACEIWYGKGDVDEGRVGDIHYRHDADVLFGVVLVSEAQFTARPDKTPLQQATDSAYRQIFSLLESLDYPYLFRFWNYIADINTHSFGLERYRQFNLGRQEAFLAHGREVVGNVPAACALGFGQCTETTTLTIAFLAGRVAPRNIENPRQISAYQYPQQYGPRSPTFSRASLVTLGQDEVLFISGTASIVGHATLHPCDAVAQTRETVANIEAVLAEANAVSVKTRFNLASLHYKVYVRHVNDLDAVRAELERLVGGKLNAIYLQADVCREDLLLEIEATAGHPTRMPDKHANAA